ncbi:DinB superfamily protein [compost metagenome]
MLNKPLAGEYAEYFGGYINKVPEGQVLELLHDQIGQAREQFGSLSEEQGNFRYAEGKWSLKEVLGHIADTERVMSYRLLRIARGDKTPLQGFNEELFVNHANSDDRSVQELLEEFAIVRTSTLSLMQHLTDDAWLRTGTFSDNNGSARALAYIMAGHALHHFNIIQDRYLNA